MKATCHPERPHEGKGLCKSCYEIARLKAKPLSKNQQAARNATPAAKIRKARWMKNNPMHSRLNHRLKRYGISQDDYDLLMERQHGNCKVCLQPMSKPCIDHNHKTGKVRALLCSSCNTGLGMLREDEFRLARLLAYLRWSGTLDRLENWSSTSFSDMPPSINVLPSKPSPPSYGG